MVNISLDKSFQNNLSLDSIVRSYSLIQLETSDKYLIGDITQVEYVGNRYYVADSNNNAIIVFDQEGKVIYMLKAVGRGPDGFSNISYIQVASDHTLFVLSGFKGIVSFDKNGNYLSSTKYMDKTDTLGAIYAFALTGRGDYYLWNGSVGIDKALFPERFFIYRFSNSMNITGSYLPIKFKFFGTRKIFYGNEGDYLLQTLNGVDTILRANSDGIYPAYYVDFGQTKIPKGTFPKSTDTYLKTFFMIQRETEWSTAIDSPIETEKYLFFQFTNTNVSRFAFYSLKTGNVITGTFPFRKLLGYPAFSCNAENKLVGYIDISKARAIPQSVIDQFSPFEMEIYKKILMINTSNNPVLITLDIKDF